VPISGPEPVTAKKRLRGCRARLADWLETATAIALKWPKSLDFWLLGYRCGGSQSTSLSREIDSGNEFGAKMVKLVVRDRESIQEAVRRFRKLVERSGIKKEMRRREYYEKPSETNRRARLRAERRTKRTRLLSR
jgi:small subunit ribosomal protein S21